MAQKTDYRRLFKLTPSEHVALREALFRQRNQVESLGRTLGLDGRYAGTTDEQLTDELLSKADSTGQLRRLLRRLRKNGNPIVQTIVKDCLHRSFEQDDLADELVGLLRATSRSHWSHIFALLKEQLRLVDTVEPLVREWATPPPGDTEYKGRIEELIEILTEFPVNDGALFEVPLINFVRAIFCTPIGTELPILRNWLQKAVTANQRTFTDVLLVSNLTLDRLNNLEQQVKGILPGRVVASRSIAPVEDELRKALQHPTLWVGVVVGRIEEWKGVIEQHERFAGPLPSYEPIVWLLPQSESHLDALPESARKILLADSFVAPFEDSKLRMLITGEYSTQAPSPIRGALHDEVAAELRQDAIVILLGPSADDGRRGLSGKRLAHELMVTLDARLKPLHPILPLDVAAYLFGLKKGEPEIQTILETWLAPDLERPLPAAHAALAGIFRTIFEHSPAGKMQKNLVVTTNIDTAFELALLAAGVPFTRIVQHDERTVANCYNIEFNDEKTEWWLKGKRSVELRPANDKDLKSLLQALVSYGSDKAQRVPRTPWQDADPGLLVYKFHGSVDQPESVVLSLADYDCRNGNQVPAEILNAIKNRRWLSIGYTGIDPQLRHLRQSFLSESARADNLVFNCDLAGDCRAPDNICIEQLVWDQLEESLREDLWADAAEGRADQFLAKLRSAL